MADKQTFSIVRQASASQQEARSALLQQLASSPIPQDELLDHLSLYGSRHALGRVLLMHALYQQILDVHGAIVLFGVRWGRDMAILQTLRSILEPGNAARQIIAFDTFSGFPSVTDQDGDAEIGGYSVTDDYVVTLEEVLRLQDVEAGNPYARREIVQGDASQTFPSWLKEHPGTVISMAYFDMDIYEPTRDCLGAMKDFVTKGTVVGFDEAAHPTWPGETIALREAWGLSNIRLQRTKYAGYPSYFVVE